MEKSNSVRHGSLYILDNMIDSRNSRISREFAGKLSQKLATLSRLFFDCTGDLFYVYRERQATSFILIAISKFCKAVFAEIPTRRGNSRDHSHGWIDYMALYKERTFLIEVKHCYSSTKNKKSPRRITDQWKQANDQLHSVSHSRCKDLCYGKNDVVKVSLMLTTFYVSSEDKFKETPEITHRDLCKRHESIACDLSPSPN